MEGTEEIRCPEDPRKMFAKVTVGDVVFRPDNIVEIACPHCRRQRRQRGEDVDLVLHRYNLLGQHVETEVL